MKPALHATHLNRFYAALFVLVLLVTLLAACDSDLTPTPGGPNPILEPTQSATSTATPGPTATPTPTGPVTALTALSLLKPRALAWHPDAELIMLANVRPGQAVLLLGVALGDSTLSEATPGGKGENWTLLAVSASSMGVMAFGLDGTQVDMVAEGRVSTSLLDTLTLSSTPSVSLNNLGADGLKDSDAVVAGAGEAGKATDVSIALLAPGRLGLNVLPKIPALQIRVVPHLVYELFTADPDHSPYAFFDASTGEALSNK
ncbi:MAG TPA: hypothetical protein VLQ48_15180 [Chloroflexia bacterium]|nr:hypothetical protein [Chloroflexia bacterium]